MSYPLIELRELLAMSSDTAGRVVTVRADKVTVATRKGAQTVPYVGQLRAGSPVLIRNGIAHPAPAPDRTVRV